MLPLLLLALQQGPAPTVADSLVHRNGRIPPVATAVRGSPKVDGLLDDLAWDAATPVSGFRRDFPSDGKPAADDTEVRILYDDQALYVGARLHARPGTVSRRLSRRDSFTIFNDVFFVLIDAHHDHSTAAVFGVTPAGERRDAMQTNDGGALDMSWDPVWAAKTTIDSLGWNVELRIPFSQLRFALEEDAVWGIQFRRDIRSAAEAVDWSWSPRTEPGASSKYGHLAGLADIPKPGRLELLPYTLAQGQFRQGANPADPFDDGSRTTGALGADLKYGLGSALTLTATVNPDFGQVEADPAVVNLTDFETFFEERRPFFVEGAGTFAFGHDHASTLFYSRRVGRAPSLSALGSAPFVDQPRATSILGAAKVTGRSASGWSVGLMEAVTGRETARRAGASGAPLTDAAVEPLTNYLAGRVRRESRGGGSAVGAMFTAVNRRLDDPAFDRLRSGAYAGGVDLVHRFSRDAFVLRGSVAGSWVTGSTAALTATQRQSSRYFQRPDQDYARLDTTRTSLAGLSAGLQLKKVSGVWQYGLATGVTTPGYEINDAGFQTEADRIEVAGGGGYVQNAPSRLFRRMNAYVEGSQRLNFGGDMVGRSMRAGAAGDFNTMWGFSLDANYSFDAMSDRATRGGPVMVMPGEWGIAGRIRTDGRRTLSAALSGFVGGLLSGAGASGAGLSLVFRPQGSLDASLSLDYRRLGFDAYYVTQGRDPAATGTYGGRYIFAALDQDILNTTFRLNWVIRPDLSLQWYAQPFLATGDYEGYGYLAAPRTFDFVPYGQGSTTLAFNPATNRYTATAGTGATPVTFGNPDFRVRSLNSNLVLRWEYSPGSTLFLVWNQGRASAISDPTFNGVSDLARIWDDPMENVLLVKVSYYLNR